MACSKFGARQETYSPVANSAVVPPDHIDFRRTSSQDSALPMERLSADGG